MQQKHFQRQKYFFYFIWPHSRMKVNRENLNVFDMFIIMQSTFLRLTAFFHDYYGTVATHY